MLYNDMGEVNTALKVQDGIPQPEIVNPDALAPFMKIILKRGWPSG